MTATVLIEIKKGGFAILIQKKFKPDNIMLCRTKNHEIIKIDVYVESQKVSICSIYKPLDVDLDTKILKELKF